MSVTLSQVISWIITGVLAGSLAGLVLRGRRGFGRWGNVGIGLVGAVIGETLFSLLRVNFGLAALRVSLADIVQAFIGAVIFVIILFLVRRRNRPGTNRTG